MAFPHPRDMANPTLAESRRYLQRVMEVTSLELSNVARKAGLSPETLTRPYYSKGYSGRISIKTLRKVQDSTGVPMPEGMDPNPPANDDHGQTAMAIKIYNALPQEGARMTDDLKMKVVNDILKILAKERKE